MTIVWSGGPLSFVNLLNVHTYFSRFIHIRVRLILKTAHHLEDLFMVHIPGTLVVCYLIPLHFTAYIV